MSNFASPGEADYMIRIWSLRNAEAWRNIEDKDNWSQQSKLRRKYLFFSHVYWWHRLEDNVPNYWSWKDTLERENMRVNLCGNYHFNYLDNATTQSLIFLIVLIWVCNEYPQYVNQLLSLCAIQYVNQPPLQQGQSFFLKSISGHLRYPAS